MKILAVGVAGNHSAAAVMENAPAVDVVGTLMDDQLSD